MKLRRLLIDTNIYSYAMRGDDDVISILRKASLIGFTSVSIGELISGFKCGSMERENLEDLDIFLDSPRVRLYPIDENSAVYYGEILHQLRKAGKPIPTNDIWIAAVAFQHGLTLFTKDAHYTFRGPIGPAAKKDQPAGYVHTVQVQPSRRRVVHLHILHTTV